jgi:hypothetical protein
MFDLDLCLDLSDQCSWLPVIGKSLELSTKVSPNLK